MFFLQTTTTTQFFVLFFLTLVDFSPDMYSWRLTSTHLADPSARCFLVTLKTSCTAHSLIVFNNLKEPKVLCAQLELLQTNRTLVK